VTLLVDFGIAYGASVPANVFIVGSATQGLIGTNLVGSSSSPVFTQVDPNYMQSLSVSHQGDRVGGPLVTYGSRTCSLSFIDPTGEWDPYTLEQAGFTMPGVLMRVRKVAAGQTWPVFYGFVDSYVPEARAPTLGQINVTATDGFSLLNQNLAELASPIGPGHLVSTRVNLLLDALNWPADLRSIGATSSTLQQTSYGAAGLQLIQDAVKAEVGEFYQQPDGYMYLRGRQAMTTDARSNTSQAVFGSDRAGGEIPYVGRPESAWDKLALHTRVEATIDGGTNMQVAEDAVAKTRYGTYTLPESSLQLPNDADALSWANYVLAQDRKPEYRMTAITVSQAIEGLGISVMPHMLGRRFGDRVTVVRRPPAQPYGSIVDSRHLLIQGIAHEWSAGSKFWRTTWTLAPAASVPFFVVGSATQGVVGQNVIAW
jgi:hypothetical protein